MRRRALRLGTVATIITIPAFVAASFVFGANPVAAAGLPPLLLSATTATPGGTVSIEGAHWPAHRVLQAALCGGGSNSVSSDCDLSRAISFGSTDSGMVQATLDVSVPPTPCPCVVMITEVDPGAVERLALDVQGAPIGPAHDDPVFAQPSVRISNVRVVSESSWTSWFGAAAPRQLVLTVTNRSKATIHPLVVARWLQGKDAFVISSLPPQRLLAGRSAEVQLPFDLNTFADGSFTVVGEVTGVGSEQTFSSSTSAKPWGLDVAAILLAIGVLLAVADLLGRRRRDGPQDDRGTEDIEHEIATLLREEPTTRMSQIGAMQ